MNIHEYQAKELLVKFGVATPQGSVATTSDEAKKIAQSLNGNVLVVKAQVHAGGRGKGVFKNGFKGGVHLCQNAEEIHRVSEKMLGQVLVTHQTGEEGRLVRKVLVVEAEEVQRELYFAILLDRTANCPVIVASEQGGVDIEKVAEKTPELIFREKIHPLLGLQAYQTRKLIK